MDKVLNIGIVGCYSRPGAVANVMRLRCAGKAKIAACVEPIDENYEKAQKQYDFKGMNRYLTVEDMVANEHLDGIIIGSPNAFHLQNLRSIGNLNIPILLEKPLDANWKNICDVMRFCRNYNAPVLVGHCMRFAPILVKAKEMIVSGMLGKIGSANFVQYCHYGNCMYHTWRREMTNGGMMLEKATHDIDVMQWLLGSKVKSVTASGRLVAYGGDEPSELHCQDCEKIFSCPESPVNIHLRWSEGEDDFFEMQNVDLGVCSLAKCVDVPDDEINLIKFENGIHGTYSQVFYSPRSFRHRVYTICGTLGAMEIDLGEYDGKILFTKRYSSNYDKEILEFDYLKRNHYNGDGYMCRHFYEVITQNTEPLATVEQAFMAEALGYASILSQRENRQVAVSEIIPDDLKDIIEKHIDFK